MGPGAAGAVSRACGGSGETWAQEACPLAAGRPPCPGALGARRPREGMRSPATSVSCPPQAACHTAAHRVTPAVAIPGWAIDVFFFFLIKKKKSPGCISSRKTTLFSGSLISPLPNILFLRAGQPGPIETSSCHWLTSFPRLSTISSALNNLIKTTFWSERSNNYY